MKKYIADNILLEQLKQGNGTAFEYLYEKYRGMLFVAALEIFSQNEEEAKDAVQDFFILFLNKQLYNRIDKSFDHGDGTLIKNFIYACFRNECLMKLRKKKDVLQLSRPIEEYDFDKPGLDNPLQYLERKDLQILLKSAMDKLEDWGPKSAKVFELIYIDRMTRNEAAAEMGISPNSVKNMLAQALLVIRRELGKNIHSNSTFLPKKA